MNGAAGLAESPVESWMLSNEVFIPERRRVSGRLVAIAIAGIIVAVAGVILWRTTFHSTPTQPYLTAPVQRAALADTVAATGPIVAPVAVPLNFKDSGKVTEIDVKLGDTVKAGHFWPGWTHPISKRS